jgi:hypothetical protein
MGALDRSEIKKGDLRSHPFQTNKQTNKSLCGVQRVTVVINYPLRLFHLQCYTNVKLFTADAQIFLKKIT